MGHAKEYMNMVTQSSGCNNSELISKEDLAIAKKGLTTFCPGEARHWRKLFHTDVSLKASSPTQDWYFCWFFLFQNLVIIQWSGGRMDRCCWAQNSTLKEYQVCSLIAKTMHFLQVVAMVVAIIVAMVKTMVLAMIVVMIAKTMHFLQVMAMVVAMIVVMIVVMIVAMIAKTTTSSKLWQWSSSWDGFHDSAFRFFSVQV